MVVGELLSPGLSVLKAELEKGNTGALDAFWEGLEREGAPVIEPIQGDTSHHLVTFFWRGDEETSSVHVNFGGLPSFKDALERLGDTDLFYRTYREGSDWRASYQFAVNVSPPSGDEVDERGWTEVFAATRPDPLNPRRFDLPAGQANPFGREMAYSLVDLPGAPPMLWVDKRGGIQRGWVHTHSFRSDILGNDRTVWVYTPPGYAESELDYGLLVLFDGHSYLSWIPTHRILDNLLDEGRIPPLVAVLVDTSVDRGRELALHDPFAEFLATELLPWVSQTYRVTPDRARVFVAGSSQGGLTASFVALRHPELFGNVISQSGIYWWSPAYDRTNDPFNLPAEGREWLTDQYVRSSNLQLGFYLDVGLHETNPDRPGFDGVAANRQLRDVLVAKGYEVHYVEFNGDHDFYCWRGTFADGLLALMGAQP